MIKISFSIEIHSFTTKCIHFPLFHSFSRPPHSFSRPPHSFCSLLCSQGLRELRGSRAAESHCFRWKETDVLFKWGPPAYLLINQGVWDNVSGHTTRAPPGRVRTVYNCWHFLATENADNYLPPPWSQIMVPPMVSDPPPWSQRPHPPWSQIITERR